MLIDELEDALNVRDIPGREAKCILMNSDDAAQLGAQYRERYSDEKPLLYFRGAKILTDNGLKRGIYYLGADLTKHRFK